MTKKLINTEKQAFATVYWGKWDDFKDIPDKFKTLKVCLAEVEKNAGSLEYVPENMKTPEVCLAAVRRWDLALKFVPEPLKTSKLCLTALQDVLNRHVINFIPSEYFEDEEFCFEAVQHHGPALEKVPDRFKTTELCLIAVQQNSDALEQVPDELKTVELCNIAVNKRGWALEYVPEPLKTKELCLSVLTPSGWGVNYIPTKLFEDAEFLNTAIKKYAGSLQYIPESLKTAELCYIAVMQNGRTLEYVPETLKTEELCLAAVQQNGDALEYVPEVFKTAELCKIAVQRGLWALRYIPENLKTIEYSIKTIKGRDNGSRCGISMTAPYIPSEHFKDNELCLTIVQTEGWALKLIPEEMINYELCLAAVQQEGSALKYVPNELKTTELCLAAIQQNHFALKYVPAHIINDKFLLDAIQNNCKIFIDIPEAYKTEELCLVAAEGFNKEYGMDPEWMKKFLALVPDKYFNKVRDTIIINFYLNNKDLLTKREAHYYLTPKTKYYDLMSPLYMFFAAKCKARNIPDSLIFNISWVFANIFFEYHNHAIVTSIFELIARQKEHIINLRELEEICIFIHSEIKKSDESLGKTFSFSCKGRTISSILALSNEWHNQKNIDELIKYGLRDNIIIVSDWEGFPVRNSKMESADYVWNIKQLCSLKELVNEGRTMKHCVDDYAERCSKGETAIFHVSWQNKNSKNNTTINATVELLVPNRSVVQVKGKYNSLVDNITLNTIKEWAQENNIKMIIDSNAKKQKVN